MVLAKILTRLQVLHNVSKPPPAAGYTNCNHQLKQDIFVLYFKNKIT